MARFPIAVCYLVVHAALMTNARADEPPSAPLSGKDRRVYGEWRIRVRPDQGAAYEKLIKDSGLPLFREAGGRVVGWWKTLVGDLYEHVTIWEYDDMAAFEKAVGHLSKHAEFAKFVASRDPLLAGEESRFLRLATGGIAPRLDEPAKLVVQEIHRVPPARKAAYLDYMTRQGFDLLKSNGFRPVGPLVVDLGHWSQVTYLFRFESMAERERLVAAFSTKEDARTYSARRDGFVEEVTTRLLIPAPFATAPAGTPPGAAVSGRALPHREEVAPGVYAAGASDRHRSANFGWVELGDETMLIDLPRGISVPDYLGLVAASAGKPARTLALTHVQQGDSSIVQALLRLGVVRVVTSPGTRAELLATPGEFDVSSLFVVDEPTAIGTARFPVDFRPIDDVAGRGGAAVDLPGRGVLFAGPLVVHGPRTPLPGSDTARWVEALPRLAGLKPSRVVPGFGSWGGPELLDRQRRYLTELRRQVGFHIAQGRPVSRLRDAVRLPADCFVWMPYDTPTPEDLTHVFREMTAPIAPFRNRPPESSNGRPHALVLIGDQPHEPGHIEDGLRPVFEATGIVPHFTVDVATLSAENLAKVRLLVILRDGLQRPDGDTPAPTSWMTPEQERAVVAFVEGGGGFLNLHNSLGLYPDEGPYLDLVGGHYVTHGPLERFLVEVVDPDHPVTRGVGRFFVADEQHTPIPDEKRVHLLLRSRSDDGKTAAAGWVREPGRGRVCHLANGHTREVLLHPMFQELMCNAVRWCLRLDGRGRTTQVGR